MKIVFIIRFASKWGEQLFISGDLAQLGNNDPEKAVPINYLNKDEWSYTLILKEGPAVAFNYRYLLRDETNQIDQSEWINDRIICREFKNNETLVLMDTWNCAGNFENAFLTSPFQEVLLKNNFTPVKGKSDPHFTHIFRIKAPTLKKGEIICLSGNLKKMGNWDTTKILLLDNQDYPWWTLKINIDEEIFPIHYRYGLYDLENKRFKFFETLPIRSIQNHPGPNTEIIVSDGYCHFDEERWRGTGVSIPVFSIRTKRSFGVGEFSDIKLLVDWAKMIGIKLIQILPVNDTIATHTWTDSYPYAAISAFGLHPIYMDLEKLGRLEAKHPLSKQFRQKKKELNAFQELDYEQVLNFKLNYIRAIFAIRKEVILTTPHFLSFYNTNKHWLKPYAVFCFLRDKYKTADFNQWKENAVYNQQEVEKFFLKDFEFRDEIFLHFFIQYFLHCQLLEVSEYAHQNGVVLKGDIPIGVYRYSVDAWVAPELYLMNAQAGAPPDDFAVKGQNWGFPTYNWDQMELDGFDWWKKRFKQMSFYFDAFRIDHILGFFRIWQIPIHAVEGIMGYFYPSLTVSITELSEKGIEFTYERFCQPYITLEILHDFFGTNVEMVKEICLDYKEDGNFQLKTEFSTQRQVEKYFQKKNKKSVRPLQDNVKIGLFDLISNVLFFEVEGSNGMQFHLRYGMEKTRSFKDMDQHTQEKLRLLYEDYFYVRQNQFWRKQAMRKLPPIKLASNMLICGEDLGMVPQCVPGVISELGILSLEIQRMPKVSGREFFRPSEANYLSVVTPATHDMSTIRGWWEENRQKTQKFFNFELEHYGAAPYLCESWVSKEIILQHLNSPAMWAIFQIQDLLGMSENLKRDNPQEERINNPAVSKHYWQYRMHLNLEDLLQETEFNEELKACIRCSGRA
ncbi:MAG: 4-alpha-glucanotransferase [Chitinophagaceae bacterium]